MLIRALVYNNVCDPASLFAWEDSIELVIELVMRTEPPCQTCSIANQIYYNVHVHGSSCQHMNEIEASIIYLIANIQKNRRVLSISGRVREVLYWAFGSYDTVDVNSSSNFAWTNATFALKGLKNHRISDYIVKYSSIFLMVLNCIGILNMEVESL